MTIQRYELEPVFDGFCPQMRITESEDGDWIRFSDLPPSTPWLPSPNCAGNWRMRHENLPEEIVHIHENLALYARFGYSNAFFVDSVNGVWQHISPAIPPTKEPS